MSDSGGVPASWSELLARVSATLAGNEKFLRGQAARMAEEASEAIPSSLSQPAEAIAKVAVGVGPQAARDRLALFEPYLTVALKDLAQGPTDQELVRSMGVLSYVSVARCCDVALPDKATAIETKWLPALAPLQGMMREKASYSMAFLALAVGAFEQVPVFIGGGPLPASARPGEKFQLNVQKLVRYMAAAAGGAKAEDVRPAFHEFVEVFPYKLGAESLGWGDLLNAARAYYVHFEGRSVGAVAKELHELVTRFAAED